MVQMKFALSQPDGTAIPIRWAYRLYSFLLEQLEPETAGQIHEENGHLSQFLTWEGGKTLWTVSLLSPLAQAALEPVLGQLTEIPLNGVLLSAQRMGETLSIKPLALIRQTAAEERGRYYTLSFRSTTSFKSNKRYVIFPTERLIVQSLFQQWNRSVPEVPLTDEDAFQAVVNGVSITGYHMRSSQFSLKQGGIPGFTGTVTLRVQLSPPLMEVWKLLYAFAPYCGIGIKTALGMGGVTLER